MIALRLRSGRAAKAARGGFAYGSPPYGWRAVGKELVPDDAEQTVINRVRTMRGQGKSLHEAADALNADRFPPRRGERWHPQTVQRALDR